ncbi:MAG TPA: hypothetical protein VGK13_03670 [Methanocellaceae archaeon]
MIGIVASLIFFIAFQIFNWLWSGVYDHEHYNYLLDSLKSAQFFAIVFFVPLVSGVLSVVISARDAKGLLTSWSIGLVTGMVFGILTFFLFAIGAQLYLPIDEIFVITILCAIGTGAGAFIFTVITSIKAGDKFEMKHATKTMNARTTGIIIAALFLLLIVIPPAFSHIAINTNLIHRAPHDGLVISVTIDRLSNDSILLTYNGGPDGYWLKEDGAFNIELNGKNATNSDAISDSSLSASIDPAGGLNNKIGAVVNITGNDVLPKQQNNGAYCTHVIVIGISRDGTREIISDANV